MHTITIPDETFDRLAERAAKLNLSVEELVMPLLDQAAQRLTTAEDRRRAFQELTKLARERADRYPAGHVVDDSRESIYEGCGE